MADSRHRRLVQKTYNSLLILLPQPDSKAVGRSLLCSVDFLQSFVSQLFLGGLTSWGSNPVHILDAFDWKVTIGAYFSTLYIPILLTTLTDHRSFYLWCWEKVLCPL